MYSCMKSHGIALSRVFRRTKLQRWFSYGVDDTCSLEVGALMCGKERRHGTTVCTKPPKQLRTVIRGRGDALGFDRPLCERKTFRWRSVGGMRTININITVVIHSLNPRRGRGCFRVSIRDGYNMIRKVWGRRPWQLGVGLAKSLTPSALSNQAMRQLTGSG